MALIRSYAGSIASAVEGYAATINGVAGGPPLAHWRISDTSSFRDNTGERNGTWTNAGGSLVTGLPQGSDRAVDFQGIATAEVAHDPGMALSAFTLSFWFVANSYPDPAITSRMAVITKDQSGLMPGDFNVTIEEDGVLMVQFQSGGENFNIVSPRAVEIGVAYHLAVRADDTGFDVYLDGQYLGKETGYTDAWTPNTQPLRFADVPWSVIDGDVVLDEVALYDSVLIESEVITLSQQKSGPIAADLNVGNVLENVTTVIDVASTSIWVGSKANLSIAVVGQGSFGTATVNSSNDIEFTASEVSEEQADSIIYTIEDINGISDTGTIDLTVVEGGATDAYAATVKGLSGLVAYWRLGDATTDRLADSSGNGHDGLFPVAPQGLEAPRLTWDLGDGKATNFGGGGYGEVPHISAFFLARGTLAGHFKPNSLSTAMTLVSKGSGFEVRVLSNGIFQVTMGATTISTAAGVIESGVEYHFAVMWDEISSWLVLDGRQVGWSRKHTSGLTTNSDPWQFGRDYDGTLADAVMDEIALYSRRVDWSEIDALSEYIRGLPYDPTPETSQVVTNVSQLTDALTTGGSAPGHHVLLAPGTYANFQISMPASRSGLKRRPIVIRPQVPGTVTVEDYWFRVNGRWVVIAGLNARRGTVTPENGSRYVRITRFNCNDLTRLDSNNTRGFYNTFGSWGRSDHHEITDPDVQALGIIHHVQISPTSSPRGYYNLFDHNYVHDIPRPEKDGKEFLALGANNNDALVFACNTAYRNLVTNQNSDQETVSIKSSGHLIIQNHWGPQSSAGSVANLWRTGGYTWAESNWNSERVRVIFSDNVLIGERFASQCRLWTGNVSAAVWDTNPGSQPNYPQCRDVMLIGCSGDGGILVGFKFSQGNLPNLNTRVHDCDNVTVDTNWATGTIQDGVAPIPYTPAVPLSTAQVGTTADDPLVPEGFL